ncbi:MAG: PQQ-binding-like beta-propeller repeat protein [Verrucomicrobiae bacterium]|nr:PQQ-binding-like beta-propeller repeat protein [Verrucomicrobiae bacterium]
MRFPTGPLLAALCFLAVPALADWPNWRGPGHNGHAPPDAPALPTLPTDPAVLWQIPAGEGLASPVVSGGRVFAFDNQGGRETLRALDAATGTERWRADIDEPFSDSQGPTGPRNTPTVDGDRVYAVSCRGELQCRRVSDGSLVWRANYVKDFGAEFIGERGLAPGAARHGNNGSPLIDGEHLIAPVGGRPGAGVVCFDKHSGAVLWKSTDDQAGYAPAVVGTLHDIPQVVCFTAIGVVGLDRRSGRELWRVPVRTSYARHVTTPVLHRDLVIVSSHEAGLLGIRVSRQNNEWSADLAWTSKDAAMNFASPVAVGDHLYGVGPARDLVCVEMTTGRLRWSQPGILTTSPGNAYAGFIAMEDRILALTDGGELLLFAASPAAYQEHGRAQVSSLNWCNPAYSAGVVYLRDGLRQTGRWRAVRVAD